jgi:carbamoyl-phosphate synthase large subunit
MEKKVLITGVGGPIGISALKYFKARGFTVIGADMRDVRTVEDSFRLLPPADDASYAQVLMRCVADSAPLLLVPTVTEELTKLARLKPRLEANGCAVYISRPEAVDVADNKFKTAMFMEMAGVAVPSTLYGLSPKYRVISDLGLPIIAKPCLGRGGLGVALLSTEEEVYAEEREGIVFQEFIPGDEFNANLFVDKGGAVLASVVLRKTELKDGMVGNAVKVERAERHDVAALCRRAAWLLKLEGPLDFDVRLRADGTPALLEINARVGANVLSAPEVLDALVEAYLGSGLKPGRAHTVA